MLLTIPHAVLCRRFLAACVACTLPHLEADPGYQTLIHQDPGAGTSPTQHPVSAYQVIYKLRTYSLEKLWFSACITSHKSCSGFGFYPVLTYILSTYYLPMVDVMVLFFKVLSMMGKLIYTILEVAEFQIWNLWECFQVQRMRSGQCCLLSSICWRRSCYWKKSRNATKLGSWQ